MANLSDMLKAAKKSQESQSNGDESEKPSESAPAAGGFRLRINAAASATPVASPAAPESDAPARATSLVVAEPRNPVPALSDLAAIASLGDDVESASDTSNSLAGITSFSAFDDEVLPTAPDRPADGLTEEQLGFIKSLDTLYLAFDDGPLFVNAVQRIMIDLNAAPHLIEMMAPEDSNVMLRGMRASAGMARVKKVEAKAKRAGGKGKMATGKNAEVISSIQALAASHGGFDD